MGHVIVLVLAGAAVGFVFGYAVRAAISRRRRAVARRRSQMIPDQGSTPSLVPPNNPYAAAQSDRGHHSDAPVVPDQSPVPYSNVVRRRGLKN